jgi:signal transduction histidine kinase
MHNLGQYANQVFSGLRFRLLLMVAVACAPLAFMTLHASWDERRRAKENWQQRSERVLEVARREDDKLIGETRRLLLALAASAPVRNGNRRGSMDLVEQLHNSDHSAGYKDLVGYKELGVSTTNGDILAIASAASLPMGTNQAQRDFFKRVLDTASFVIEDFPTDDSNGSPLIHFGYPVFDRFGQAQAVVFASLDLRSFDRFGSELASELPRGATWVELDRRGNPLGRYPTPRSWASEAFPERALLKPILARSEGVIEGEGAGGVPTFYAFATTHNQLVGGETVSILGIPKNILFATADDTLRRNIGWLSLAVAFAVLLGWFASDLLFLRPVRALVRSSTRLAAGDLSARTGLPHGPDELGRLTLAFDLMAQALEQRELDRRGASQKLQILSQRLVEVQESERRQIARELHDEIGQSLTVAEMNLQAALKSGAEAKLAHRIQESMNAIELVLEQVHDLSLNLRPSMLDDLGLEPALRWYLNRQAASAGLEARFRADTLERRMDPTIETECFRVAQEALTNVVRHSQAHRVAVELQKNDGQLHLRVRDDGIGFDVTAHRQRAVRGHSLGLLSMAERASLAGGGLEYISSKGKGTEVHAWFPLKWRDPAPEDESSSDPLPQLTNEQSN